MRTRINLFCWVFLFYFWASLFSTKAQNFGQRKVFFFIPLPLIFTIILHKVGLFLLMAIIIGFIFLSLTFVTPERLGDCLAIYQKIFVPIFFILSQRLLSFLLSISFLKPVRKMLSHDWELHLSLPAQWAIILIEFGFIMLLIGFILPGRYSLGSMIILFLMWLTPSSREALCFFCWRHYLLNNNKRS